MRRKALKQKKFGIQRFLESGIHWAGIRNPQGGIQNPRLSWIPLHGPICWLQFFLSIMLGRFFSLTMTRKPTHLTHINAIINRHDVLHPFEKTFVSVHWVRLDLACHSFSTKVKGFLLQNFHILGIRESCLLHILPPIPSSLRGCLSKNRPLNLAWKIILPETLASESLYRDYN